MPGVFLLQPQQLDEYMEICRKLSTFLRSKCFGLLPSFLPTTSHMRWGVAFVEAFFEYIFGARNMPISLIVRDSIIFSFFSLSFLLHYLHLALKDCFKRMSTQTYLVCLLLQQEVELCSSVAEALEI